MESAFGLGDVNYGAVAEDGVTVFCEVPGSTFARGLGGRLRCESLGRFCDVSDRKREEQRHHESFHTIRLRER